MNLGFLSTPNRWAVFMIGLWFLLAVGYITWHKIDEPGCKYIMISASELNDIQSILDDSTEINNPDSSESSGVSRDTSSKKQSDSTPKQPIRDYGSKRDSVYQYIIGVHRLDDSTNKSESDYKAEFRRTLRLMPNKASLRAFLSTRLIRVYSPYHLEGRKLLWELICWAWFGVFCSIFYNVSEAYKGAKVENVPVQNATGQAVNSTEVKLTSQPTEANNDQSLSLSDKVRRRLLNNFDPAEVPSHIGKLIYTPFLVVVFYLYVVSYGSNADLQRVQIGEGVIVFAFVLGFFSGRMVDLLENIKELLFRWGSQQSLRTPASTPGDKPVPDKPNTPDQSGQAKGGTNPAPGKANPSGPANLATKAAQVLKSGIIAFHLPPGDDKDINTKVSVYVIAKFNNQFDLLLAKKENFADTDIWEDDGQHTYTYQLDVTPIDLAQIDQDVKTTIRIISNGNDTVKFDYTLTLVFDDGDPNTAQIEVTQKRTDIALSQDNRTYIS